MIIKVDTVRESKLQCEDNKYTEACSRVLQCLVTVLCIFHCHSAASGQFKVAIIIFVTSVKSVTTGFPTHLQIGRHYYSRLLLTVV